MGVTCVDFLMQLLETYKAAHVKNKTINILMSTTAIAGMFSLFLLCVVVSRTGILNMSSSSFKVVVLLGAKFKLSRMLYQSKSEKSKK